jgi:hypothetical protein
MWPGYASVGTLREGVVTAPADDGALAALLAEPTVAAKIRELELWVRSQHAYGNPPDARLQDDVDSDVRVVTDSVAEIVAAVLHAAGLRRVSDDECVVGATALIWALRLASVKANLEMPDCARVNANPDAEDDRNPGGLCGPCCELLAGETLLALRTPEKPA